MGADQCRDHFCCPRDRLCVSFLCVPNTEQNFEWGGCMYTLFTLHISFAWAILLFLHVSERPGAKSPPNGVLQYLTGSRSSCKVWGNWPSRRGTKP